MSSVPASIQSQRKKIQPLSLHCYACIGRGALIPYGGAEKYFGKCEILVGDSNSVRWEDRAGYPSFEGFNIVEGGNYKIFLT